MVHCLETFVVLSVLGNAIFAISIAQVLGDNLLSLIKLHDYRGVPIPTVKRITRQVYYLNT